MSTGGCFHLGSAGRQLPLGRDGLSPARKVTDLWQDVLLLITSGGLKILDEDIPHEARFLTKPYSDRELLRHMEAMIADRYAATERSGSHALVCSGAQDRGHQSPTHTLWGTQRFR